MGCGGNEVSGYAVVGDLGGEELCVAFRDGDKLKDIITAGMMVLASDTTLSQLSVKWLGEDKSIMPGNPEMSGWLQNQPQRVFILGYYEGARPMCFDENGQATGFDADMFTELCSRLGWELKFQSVQRGSAAVELASGNIDCMAGGFGTDDDAESLSVSTSYLSCKYEFITKAGSGINRVGQLKDKVLGTVSSSAMGKALEADEKLIEKLDSLRIFASEEECFTALDAGTCDAILVSSLCADYYMR